jgi:hypothetical protein
VADGVQFSVDVSKLTAAIQQFTSKIPAAKQFSALSVGYEILRLSQLEVPHDKGTLQNSGNVEQIDDYVVVGYHTPYAARLHEHPDYRFQKGRKGRYLADPIIHNMKALGLRFTEELDKELK